MKSIKCPQCSMVNWASAETCKRCGAHLQLANDTLAAQAAYATAAQPAYATTTATTTQPVYHPTTQPAYAMPAPSAPYNYQPLPYQQHYYPPRQKSNGMAVASLIIGIVSIFTLSLLGLAALAGIILGIVALVKIKNHPAEYEGQGMAIAGIVTSALSLVVGFSIIMAIAIPNLMASRRAANEASTMRQMRTISGAEATYQSTTGAGEFGTLQELRNAGLIKEELSDGDYNGYRFSVRIKRGTRETLAGFEAVATPLNYGSSGNRSFYMDETGVIRSGNNRGAEADAQDMPIGN